MFGIWNPSHCIVSHLFSSGNVFKRKSILKPSCLNLVKEMVESELPKKIWFPTISGCVDDKGIESYQLWLGLGFQDIKKKVDKRFMYSLENIIMGVLWFLFVSIQCPWSKLAWHLWSSICLKMGFGLKLKPSSIYQCSLLEYMNEKFNISFVW